jgi:hypothetical protein
MRVAGGNAKGHPEEPLAEILSEHPSAAPLRLP